MCMSFCISIFKKFRSSRNQGNGLVSYSAPFIPRTAFQCCRFHSFATRMTKVTHSHSNSLTYMKMWRNGEGFGDATEKGLWETASYAGEILEHLRMGLSARASLLVLASVIQQTNIRNILKDLSSNLMNHRRRFKSSSCLISSIFLSTIDAIFKFRRDHLCLGNEDFDEQGLAAWDTTVGSQGKQTLFEWKVVKVHRVWILITWKWKWNENEQKCHNVPFALEVQLCSCLVEFIATNDSMIHWFNDWKWFITAWHWQQFLPNFRQPGAWLGDDSNSTIKNYFKILRLSNFQ